MFLCPECHKTSGSLLEAPGSLPPFLRAPRALFLDTRSWKLVLTSIFCFYIEIECCCGITTSDRSILMHGNGRYGYYTNSTFGRTSRSVHIFPAAAFWTLRLRYFIISLLLCYSFVIPLYPFAIPSLFLCYPFVIPFYWNLVFFGFGVLG